MTTIPHPLVDHPACRVLIDRANDQLGVYARDHLPVGTAILFVDGQATTRPTRHSVQVGIDEHIDVPPDAGEHDAPWRYLNHSCDPVAVLHGRVLVALRDIPRGDPVTFDYDGNEWDMAAPFACGCGAANCRGWIRGFRHLGDLQRLRLLPRLSPHLVALLRAPTHAPDSGRAS